MRICEKILMNRKQLQEHGPITIVAFGDSVTHGALAEDEINFETVYHNLLKQKIAKVRTYVPITVINAGIGGTSAAESLLRMDSQVLAHNPDLIIICFGLNDINGELNDYLAPMKTIFEKALASGAEVVFMTPNMLNTSVAEDTAPQHLNYAHKTADYQNNGRMDLYMAEAIKLAKELGVTVCDCYAKWKELSKTQDITKLLINRINHPTKEMHELFAQSLFETLFNQELETVQTDSTMYQG